LCYNVVGDLRSQLRQPLDHLLFIDDGDRFPHRGPEWNVIDQEARQ